MVEPDNELVNSIQNELQARWEYATFVDSVDTERIRAIRSAGRRAVRNMGRTALTTVLKYDDGQTRVAVYVKDIPEDARREMGRRAAEAIGRQVRTTEGEIGNGKVRVAVYVEDIPADVMAEQQARAVEASA